MIKNNLPVILLKGLVLLPLGEARVELNNDITKKVIDISKLYHDNQVLIVTPINDLEESPDTSDLPSIGVSARITSRIDLPNGNARIVLKGIKRVKVLSYVNYSNEKDVLESIIVSYRDEDYNEVEETALLRKLINELDKYISESPYVSNAILSQIKGITDLDKITDLIASFLPLTTEKKIAFMVDVSRVSRAKKLITELNIDLAVLALENKIEQKLKEGLEDMQKDMILKEKIKIIKEELGEKDNKSDYINKVNEKINSSNIPENILMRIKSELDRYEVTLESSPELSVIRSYLDYILSLPFGVYTKIETDLNKVKEDLEKTHYGLNEVKERILEYIAVEDKNQNPILCLIGPPGVGKTTLAESIASSINKNFAKISLGGINDPAELIGHRKTYIGSGPGKIINAIRTAKSMNPLILLDEIDKLSRDYKGDPMNALLDVLDNKQNSRFVDNYIEEAINLSDVTWVITANSKDSIPYVLLDRLEIIEITSYLPHEKLEIAKNYIVPRALKSNDLVDKVRFENDTLIKIIKDYTKESGVRELERLINKILRKIIKSYKLENKIVENKVISTSDLIEYLGLFNEIKEKKDMLPGRVRCIAYTHLGGNTIEIEVTSYEGKSEFITTGHLGKVLKESIKVSLSYIKSNIDKFKIDKKVFNKTIHLNFREINIEKEGASAGIAITTAILSYLLNIPVSDNISMSGEITLLGEVLPVGGLKEKIAAALRCNIDKIYISEYNMKEISTLDSYVLESIEFVFVKNYMDIYKDLFER